MKKTLKEFLTIFCPSFEIIDTHEEAGGKIKYACVRTGRSVDKIKEDYSKTRIKILEGFAKKDANGKPEKDVYYAKNEQNEFILDGVGRKKKIGEQYIFETPEDEKRATDEIESVLSSEIEIDIHGVDIEEFANLKIASVVLRNVGDFVIIKQE